MIMSFSSLWKRGVFQFDVGELLPNLDTAFAFLIPKWKLIRAGKGDDQQALHSLSQKQNSSSQSQSIRSQKPSAVTSQGAGTNTIDVLVEENNKLKKKLAEFEKTAKPGTKKTVNIKEADEKD
jgi:hypothetical protein